ncbi:MAG TPA: hypothetical protein VGR20_05090, partial [Acidimicrobiia bacterium]|nr:hypothetical protein [Acidimicrobiia bacterium]
MATECVIRPWERQLFLRCRRAWDLGALERQGFEPALPAQVVDLDQAVKDALAVYYFPGMWDWNRAIVAPLATEAFSKAMRTSRQNFEAATGAALDEDASARWDAEMAAGQRLLPAYYAWAADIDTWSTVQVETLFDVTVPEPGDPETGLLAEDGRGVLYRVRIDLVVVDDDGKYWLVEHRLRRDGFAELDDLLLDDVALTRSWSWELGFLATVAGTIHNELRLPGPDEPGPDDPGPLSVGPAGPDDVEVIDLGTRLVQRESGIWFRRTVIPRPRPEIESAGEWVAEESRRMTRAGLECYPTPALSTCTPCEFQAPCRALMEGENPEPVLAEAYRARPPRDFEEGRLGSVWGFVPHRPDHTHVRDNPQGP